MKVAVFEDNDIFEIKDFIDSIENKIKSKVDAFIIKSNHLHKNKLANILRIFNILELDLRLY